MGLGFGRDNHCGIVKRVLADESLFRLVEFGFRLNDQEKIIVRPGDDTISDGAWNVDVVALFEIERAEIGFYGSFAAMDEDQLVAVRIAIVERHWLGAPRNVQRYVVVPEERHRHALGITLICRGEPV